MRHVLRQKAAGGEVFAFRGKRGDRLKLLHWVSHWNAVAIVSRTNGATMATPRERRSVRHWFEKPLLERHWFKPNGGGARRKQGFWLYDKVLERGRFPWPTTQDGAVRLTSAQLSMLWEG